MARSSFERSPFTVHSLVLKPKFCKSVIKKREGKIAVTWQTKPKWLEHHVPCQQQQTVDVVVVVVVVISDLFPAVCVIQFKEGGV